MRSQEVKIRKHIQRALRKIGIKSKRKNFNNSDVRLTRHIIRGDKKWFREILSGWSSEDLEENFIVIDNKIENTLEESLSLLDNERFSFEIDNNKLLRVQINDNTVNNCSMYY